MYGFKHSLIIDLVNCHTVWFCTWTKVVTDDIFVVRQLHEKLIKSI